MPWTCPSCGTEYEIPPKWCRCTAYPLPEPGLRYLLVKATGERSPKEFEISAELFQRYQSRMQNHPKFSCDADLEPPETGYFLVEEAFEAHVETLDSRSWEGVEMSEMEFEEALSERFSE